MAVSVRLDALLAKLKSGSIPAGIRALSMVDMQFAIADGLRDGARAFSSLAADLASAEAGDASKLLERADKVTGRDASGHYDSSIVGLLAIACVDQPLGGANTLDAFQALANATRATHPRGTSAAMLPWALCTDWPYRRAAPRLAINGAASPKALVIAGTYDPITGYAQGAELVRLLANGSPLVTYDADGHAAALHSACIRDQVTAFLIDPSQAPTKTTCAAE
jgi:pimeloyl-ACP methyl ester carboxylesterase